MEDEAFVGLSAFGEIIDIADPSAPDRVARLDMVGDVDTLTPVGNVIVASVDDDAGAPRAGASHKTRPRLEIQYSAAAPAERPRREGHDTGNIVPPRRDDVALYSQLAQGHGRVQSLGGAREVRLGFVRDAHHTDARPAAALLRCIH